MLNNLIHFLNGAINNNVTTITVDTTAGFPTSGTLLIGSEQIDLYWKNMQQHLLVYFCFKCAAAALDDATVKLASFY